MRFLQFLVALAVTTPLVLGQVVVDGVAYNNYTDIDTAIVNSWGLRNHGDATIVEATVNGGWIENRDKSQIGTVTLNERGSLENFDAATIGSMIVNDIGKVYNYGSATIDSITLSGTRNSGLANSGNGVVKSATINSGYFFNNGDSTLVNATINDGVVQNATRGKIGTITVNGGGVQTFHNATIDNVILNGGGVDNISRIENLTYTGGIYTGTSASFGFGAMEGEGSIGTLTVLGDATGIDWGNVDTLKFGSDGSGIISLSAYIAAQEPSTGIMMLSTALSPEIQFSGIQAGTVDLTYGNVFVDLTGIGTPADFSLGSLFGGATVSGNLASFQANWDYGTDWTDAILSVFDATRGDWTFTSTGLTYIAPATDTAVPEPATLAVIGLGLAGLGYARRRQMKKRQAA